MRIFGLSLDLASQSIDMIQFYPFRLIGLVGVSVIFSLAGCSPKKKMLTNAKKLEDAGMLQSAMSSYRTISNDYESVDAEIGMHRVAQQLLNTKCQAALSSCMAGRYPEGLQLMQEAKSFYQLNKDLEISFPDQMESQMERCKSDHINELLNKAEMAILDLDLEAGNGLLDKVFQLDYDNPSAKSLLTLTRIIPLYNEGQKALELELWRSAYDAFNKVCAIDASYRDAKVKRDIALTNGRHSIAYLIKDGVAPIRVAQSLGSHIKGELIALKNPFIELLERSDLEVLIREQQSSLGAEYDSENGPIAGKLKRANYLLYGEIVSYKATTEPERTNKCDCGKTMNINSEKVECYEHVKRRQVEMSFRFQLVDAETGKIFLADVLHEKTEDIGSRYDFEVSKKLSLMSPTLTKEHTVDLSGMRQPQENFLLTENEISEVINAKIALSIATLVNSFSPER